MGERLAHGRGSLSCIAGSPVLIWLCYCHPWTLVCSLCPCWCVCVSSMLPAGERQSTERLCKGWWAGRRQPARASSSRSTSCAEKPFLPPDLHGWKKRTKFWSLVKAETAEEGLSPGNTTIYQQFSNFREHQNSFGRPVEIQLARFPYTPRTHQEVWNRAKSLHFQ